MICVSKGNYRIRAGKGLFAENVTSAQSNAWPACLTFVELSVSLQPAHRGMRHGVEHILDRWPIRGDAPKPQRVTHIASVGRELNGGERRGR